MNEKLKKFLETDVLEIKPGTVACGTNEVFYETESFVIFFSRFNGPKRQEFHPGIRIRAFCPGDSPQNKSQDFYEILIEIHETDILNFICAMLYAWKEGSDEDIAFKALTQIASVFGDDK